MINSHRSDICGKFQVTIFIYPGVGIFMIHDCCSFDPAVVHVRFSAMFWEVLNQLKRTVGCPLLALDS